MIVARTARFLVVQSGGDPAVVAAADAAELQRIAREQAGWTSRRRDCHIDDTRPFYPC